MAARFSRVGARLSRVPDVAGCIVVPWCSPADSRLGRIFIHRCQRRGLTLLPRSGRLARDPTSCGTDVSSFTTRSGPRPCKARGFRRWPGKTTRSSGPAAIAWSLGLGTARLVACPSSGRSFEQYAVGAWTLCS